MVHHYKKKKRDYELYLLSFSKSKSTLISIILSSLCQLLSMHIFIFGLLSKMILTNWRLNCYFLIFRCGTLVYILINLILNHKSQILAFSLAKHWPSGTNTPWSWCHIDGSSHSKHVGLYHFLGQHF